jgi:hypothetical protein
MLKNILPLGVDELIALIVLVITFLFPQEPFLVQVQGLTFIYLFMCIAFRKYEAIRQKYDNKSR